MNSRDTTTVSMRKGATLEEYSLAKVSMMEALPQRFVGDALFLAAK